MWKDFFYYSKSERRAVVVLAALFVVLSGVALWLRHERLSHVPVLTVSEIAGIDTFMAQLKEREASRVRYSYPHKEKFPAILKEFDPNTADSVTFRTLGLPSFIARNMIRYREKGGVFRSADAFAKIYGLSSAQFEELEPYIVISEEFRKKSFPVRDSLRKDSAVILFKYPVGTLVDLNTADTTELKKIPGIGSGIARMILAYRERLGGFVCPEQIKEVDYVDAELCKWFKVESPVYRKILVNKDGLDKLRRHPYMNFYKAKAILEYRRKRGKIEGVSRLSLFEEFSEADLERLASYLSFD